jgi:hypothetical protein
MCCKFTGMFSCQQMVAHFQPLKRGIRKHRVLGKPIKALVSTSYVEKHNQTMRQHMRRFTRLTNGHSKKIENHVHMVALYTTWYKFARINSAVRMSPAMAARLTDLLWDIGDIVKLIEEWEATTQSKPI